MRRKQLGISLSGLIMGAAILIGLAVVGMKLAPSYIEFFAIKKAVNAIASSGSTSPAEVRKSFDQRASVDDISTVKGSDLQVEKGSISVSYRKEVPLVANVGFYIDFNVSSTTK
jgi:hypothetical protein